MIQLAYISKATDEFNQDVEENIFNILETARKHNGDKGISGLLIYRNGYFLQLLEGNVDSVLQLYGKIATDSRHVQIRTLFKQESSLRLFPNWAMGFSKLENEELEAVTNIIPWDEIQGFLKNNQSIPNEKILKIFKTFKYKEAA
jgi:hypothetical protein